jgi:hypothetical protein
MLWIVIKDSKMLKHKFKRRTKKTKSKSPMCLAWNPKRTSSNKTATTTVLKIYSPKHSLKKKISQIHQK